MTVKRDYYEILGIPRDASDSEIKKAFRKLAFQYHPDRNSGDGTSDKFKEVNEAYEVLSNVDKRAAYNRFGHDGVQGVFSRSFEGSDSDFGGFGDIFDMFFGGTTTTTRGASRHGADLQSKMTITFEEAALGCEKEINITRTETCSVCSGSGSKPGSQTGQCPTCNGSGQVRRVQQSLFGRFINTAVCNQCNGEGKIITDPCQQCRRSGREKQKRTLSVQIPPGVNDSSTLRLSGEGEAGIKGGSPGDLFVTLSIRKHEFFTRDDDNILYELPVNFTEAALGTEVEVPTLYGKSKINIPSGSQTGKIFRLKDKGIPHLYKHGRGDQFIRILVVTPGSLTKEQRKLLQELARTIGPTKRINPDN